MRTVYDVRTVAAVRVLRSACLLAFSFARIAKCSIIDHVLSLNEPCAACPSDVDPDYRRLALSFHTIFFSFYSPCFHSQADPGQETVLYSVSTSSYRFGLRTYVQYVPQRASRLLSPVF